MSSPDRRGYLSLIHILEALGLLRREEVVERRVGDKTLQMVRLTEAEPEKRCV